MGFYTSGFYNSHWLCGPQPNEALSEKAVQIQKVQDLITEIKKKNKIHTLQPFGTQNTIYIARRKI